jgi:hypothetical protein
MKKMKIIFSIAALFAGILLFNSCTKDFEEINTDPNNAIAELAAPDMMLTNAIESMTDRVHEIFLGHEMGSCWVQHMAKVQYTDEDRYMPRLAVINNTWTSLYAASGMDVYTMYNVAVERNHNNYQGVAIVLQCYISSVLTDLFGPIPYSAAWQGGTSPTGLLPAYDSQEFVYRDMVAKLKAANTLLDPDGLEIGGDILFNNDISSWKKFANSLRLRLLLRMSAKDASFVTTEMSAMVADPATYPVFESNADNAALAYLGSAPNNHPINENRKTRDDHRVSENFIDMLTNYGDYRIMVFANPTALNTFTGLPNGLLSSQAAAFNGNGLANTCKIGSYFTAATAPGQLMSYAELQFILAEAALKGYIPGGITAAKTFYDAGVTGSFMQYEAPLQEIFDAHAGSTYGGLSIGDPYTVAEELAWHITDAAAPAFFDAATITNDHALELILEQKYIAMFDQGLQSAFEWRRTRIPVLTPAAAGVLGGKIPLRVTFPTDEYARNPSNVSAAVSLLGGADLLTTKVWWDVNP